MHVLQSHGAVRSLHANCLSFSPSLRPLSLKGMRTGPLLCSRQRSLPTARRGWNLAHRFHQRCSLRSISTSVNLTTEQTDQLHQLTDILLSENKKVNLTAIRTPEDVAIKHIQDALTLLETIDSEHASSIIDVGTGAGFPGLVLAIARPHIHVTLLDSVRKKTNFHDLAISQIGLENVESVWARGEDAAHGPLRESQCLAVARSVAEMRVLAELTLPFVRVGGMVIAQKALDDSRSEIIAAEGAVRTLGGAIEEVRAAWPREWGDGGQLHALDGTVRVKSLVILRKERETAKKYPRKPGVPGKSPLR